MIQGIEFEVFEKKRNFCRSSLYKVLKVLIYPFIMKVYHRLLLHVIFYLKIDKITEKSQFEGKATLVSVVAGYRNTVYI